MYNQSFSETAKFEIRHTVTPWYRPTN